MSDYLTNSALVDYYQNPKVLAFLEGRQTAHWFTVAPPFCEIEDGEKTLC